MGRSRTQYDRNARMEQLHFAYVSAVVASAGHLCYPIPYDRGIDCNVNEWRYNEQRGYYDAGTAFNCQLKSSYARIERTENQVVYRMRRRAYNKLVDWDGHQFSILVVFYMPKDEEEWFSQNEDIMSLKHCCYWTELEGGAIEKSETNVVIDRAQTFTSQTVQDLIARASKREISS